MKRFSRYRFAKKVAGGTGATGSALAKFIEYDSGAKTPTYTRDEASKPGESVIVYLQPFSINTTATSRYQVLMSGRVNTKGLAGLAASAAVFNHDSKPTSADDIKVNELYDPAKAIINLSSGATVQKTSQITGQTYDAKSTSESYTVPFGSDGTKLQQTVMQEIVASVASKNDSDTNNNYTVNFKSENIRGL